MIISSTRIVTAVILMSTVLFTIETEAQRMPHGGGARGGGGRPAVSRPATSNSGSINGGHQRSPDRSVGTRSFDKSPPSIPSRTDSKVGDRAGKIETKKSENNKTGNKTNVGNRVTIDNSKKNVNINVDNSKDINIRNNRNTVVRRNTNPYRRPPYVYGGRRYYCYHPYYYHPYRPFYWGPVWHPWGFFVATLATTAIVLTIESQQYHYDQGVYYIESNGGYTVVQAPVGAMITVLPEGSEKVVVNETTNNYYYGGTYYEKTNEGYTVVPPTSGTVVENLPEGGEEVKIGDQTYVKYGETYYQPIQQGGKSMYEVVDVQEGEK